MKTNRYLIIASSHNSDGELVNFYNKEIKDISKTHAIQYGREIYPNMKIKVIKLKY